jgi:hypothetical protein
MSEKPRPPTLRGGRHLPLVEVGLRIDPSAGGRYLVRCKDADGRLHVAIMDTWRAACVLAGEAMAEVAKELQTAGLTLPPRVNGE